MKHFLEASPKIVTILLLLLIVFHQFRLKTWRAQNPSRGGNHFKIPAGILLVSVLGSACLFLYDPFLLAWIQSIRHPAFDAFKTFGGNLGKNIHPWMFLAGSYLFFYLAKKDKLRQWFFSGILSALLAAVLSFFFKFIFLRARPYADLGAFSFFHIQGLTKDARMYQSFSSGDVAIVAAISAHFFYALKNRAVRWLLVLLPIATACSRVALNKHWPSDTLLSVGIGFAAAMFISSKTNENHPC